MAYRRMARYKATRIFQINPKRFEVDRFIASSPTSCHWLANKSLIGSIGCRVFLWRAVGDQRKDPVSGVFGFAEVVGEPVERLPDADTRHLWKYPADRDAVVLRVPLKIIKIVDRSATLRLQSLRSDLELQQMSFLGLGSNRQGTIFYVTESHGDRLALLWAKHVD